MSERTAPARLGGSGVDEDLPSLDDIGVQDIFLRHLSVKPSSILPFGAAVLRWDVDAPPTVRIKINDELVTQAGSKVVQPAYSTSYRVVALRGARITELGRVDLEVDRSACTTSEFANPTSLIASTLNAFITLVDDVTTQLPPVVTFQSNRITFVLTLSGKWSSTIRIEASFGLSVVDARLVSTTNQVSADVQIPWYLWFAPGALPGLAIARDGAREKATAAGFVAIRRLVEVLEFYWATPPGKARHSVRIGRTESGVGVLETTDCPTTPLDQLAELGENPIVIDR